MFGTKKLEWGPGVMRHVFTGGLPSADWRLTALSSSQCPSSTRPCPRQSAHTPQALWLASQPHHSPLIGWPGPNDNTIGAVPRHHQVLSPPARVLHLLHTLTPGLNFPKKCQSQNETDNVKMGGMSSLATVSIVSHQQAFSYLEEQGSWLENMAVVWMRVLISDFREQAFCIALVGWNIAIS